METEAQHMYFRCLTFLNNRAYLLPSYCSLILPNQGLLVEVAY